MTSKVLALTLDFELSNPLHWRVKLVTSMIISYVRDHNCKRGEHLCCTQGNALKTWLDHSSKLSEKA